MNAKSVQIGAGFPLVWLAIFCGCTSIPTPAAEESLSQGVLTNAAAVRSLTPEQAAKGLPVQLQGVVTFVFNTASCFVQDSSAVIYVGSGAELGQLSAGDIVVLEGFSGPGEYAPIVRPSSVRVTGRTALPPARAVSFDDLVTGREDSQWVEVEGLVRAVTGDPASYQILEIATGGGRLSAFIPGTVQFNLGPLVDSPGRLWPAFPA